MRGGILEILVSKGILTPNQAQKARETARATRGNVRLVLTDLELATPEQVRQAEEEAG
jgi:hypothetical protein